MSSLDTSDASYRSLDGTTNGSGTGTRSPTRTRSPLRRPLAATAAVGATGSRSHSPLRVQSPPVSSSASSSLSTVSSSSSSVRPPASTILRSSRSPAASPDLRGIRKSQSETSQLHQSLYDTHTDLQEDDGSQLHPPAQPAPHHPHHHHHRSSTSSSTHTPLLLPLKPDGGEASSSTTMTVIHSALGSPAPWSSTSHSFSSSTSSSSSSSSSAAAHAARAAQAAATAAAVANLQASPSSSWLTSSSHSTAAWLAVFLLCVGLLALCVSIITPSFLTGVESWSIGAFSVCDHDECFTLSWSCEFVSADNPLPECRLLNTFRVLLVLGGVLTLVASILAIITLSAPCRTMPYRTKARLRIAAILLSTCSVCASIASFATISYVTDSDSYAAFHRGISYDLLIASWVFVLLSVPIYMSSTEALARPPPDWWIPPVRDDA